MNFVNGAKIIAGFILLLVSYNGSGGVAVADCTTVNADFPYKSGAFDTDLIV